MKRFGMIAWTACVPFIALESGWPARAQVTIEQSLPEVAAPSAYYILPQDVLDVRVFGEPELSVTKLPVDTAGNLTLPLVGEIKASGKKASALADEIRARLVRYVINPRVTVLVMEPAPRQVVVEGQVNQPGLYDLPQPATLLSSLAQARGPTRVAKLGQVVVLRKIDGHRYAARFDLTDIRKGRAADPEILANDQIIVGLSGGKAAFRDLLTVAPLLTAVFVRLD